MDKEKILSSQIEIQPLKHDDIELFDPILRAHVRDSETGELIEGEIDAIKKYMQGGTDEYGRVRKYLVAKDTTSGQVLGCMAYATPDPDMVAHFQLDHVDDSIELLNAFVSPEVFRGGGVGRKLLEAVCLAGENEGKQQLVVHSGPRYEKSWGFYDKMAGENTGFIQNKYGEGRHAKTWRIKLS